MKTELRTCPFCGKPGYLHKQYIGNRQPYVYGYCNPDHGGCGGKGPTHRTDDAAASAWNTRAGDAEEAG
jgi:hypothetical protein